MTIAHSFEYLKPASIGEALRIVAKNKKALLLAGGTDLVGALKEDAVTPPLVVDLKGLRELKKIEFRGGALHLGAGVTFTEVIESKTVRQKFPVLAEIAGRVASIGIRNRATLVGNLCSAVPCLDSGPVMVAMAGFVHLRSSRGTRKVPAEKWFVHARKTSIRLGEIVTGISIPLPKKKFGACYVKLGRYQGEDLAQASVFVCVESGVRGDFKYRVAFGSVAPVPRRAHRIEKALNGHPPDEARRNAAKVLLPSEITPITDIRATKEYRLHMCGVMMDRALTAAHERSRGHGPAFGHHLI